MKNFTRLLVACTVLPFSFVLSSKTAFAATTPFRSANIITTDSLGTFYTNLENCSVTDGMTCDRATADSYANLYFRDFGNYDDFGMPEGAKISNVRIRVTGKASTGIYVGLSLGTTFAFNCQWPSDLWTLYQLAGNTINTQTFITEVLEEWKPGAVLAYCLQPYAFQNKSFIWRINYSPGPVDNWSANIDNFEIAFDYEPPSAPPPAPNPPPGPAPFLDLPWDYEGKGVSFNEAANSITSYFDHQYPMLSSGLSEPFDVSSDILMFRGPPNSNDNYSGHDGYDYGRLAKASIGDPVLAAASGMATYINSCSSCGNMIVIDHGNGYQTRYMHLEQDGLITNIPGQKVSVAARQPIGRVGATGSVSPAGALGAHIHFGVFQDKNKDGNFDDNVPDGVTDPFGWQSKEADPWPAFVFDYGGQRRTGNRSYYLWKKKIDKLDSTLTSNGGVFNTGRYKVEFPQGATTQNLNITLNSSPIITKALGTLNSIGSTIVVAASNSLGDIITSFQKLFKLTVDFGAFDLMRYKTETISIYSSTDGKTWTKEPTIVDYVTNTATSQIDHLTHFALLAERADTVPPITTATISGQQGQPNWFRSDVIVTLNAEDNEGGLGVDYTLYKIEGKDWDTYNTPLTFTTEGHHKIEFYSVDKDENVESVKSIEFDIDKTPPEAKIQLDPNTKALGISGSDNSGYATINKIDVEKNREQFTVTDRAGNSLTFIGKDRIHGKEAKFSLESLSYNNGPIVHLNKNKFHTEYSLNKDKDALKELEQRFEIDKEIKIRIKYDNKENQSIISTRVNGEEKVKETKHGLTLLQITTEKGTLKYSY